MKRIAFTLAACLIAAAIFHAPAQAQLVSPQKEQYFRALLPTVADAELSKILNADLLFYDDESIPPAYQRRGTVHSPSYNISGDQREAAKGHGHGGSANIEFPWKEPGGTDKSTVFTYRFLYLPTDAAGRKLPVVWYQTPLRGRVVSSTGARDPEYGYSWTFPNGAVVGEVLYQAGPDGYGYAFEIRTRTKTRGQWAVDVYRPFPTLRALVSQIRRLRPLWRENARLRAAIQSLESRSTVRVNKYLGDDNHVKRPAFRQWASVDYLPDLGDDRLVAELLKTTPFQSCSGTIWRDDFTGPNVFAPTTTARWHVVPTNYQAGFIEVGETSCTRCHQSVNKHATDFEDTFSSGRQWYGRVRGADQIFSFHPFSLESIADNGASLPVRMRRELTAAGIIAPFDGRVHTAARYVRSQEE